MPTSLTIQSKLIIRYKSIIKLSGIEYGDLLNYTFGIIENKLTKILNIYLQTDRVLRDSNQLITGLLDLLEFSFFIYSASPKVNHTIRLSRLIVRIVSFVKSQDITYEMKHLLFKFIYDNTIQQLRKNSMSRYREVESLYLLISLAVIGREYRLPESALVKYFLIEEDTETHEYTRTEFLNYFSITVLLSYIGNKSRYSKLKSFLESHIIAKFSSKKENIHNYTELLLLFLDLIVCPYLSQDTKDKIAEFYSLEPSDLLSIQKVNDYWFTSWDDKFNLERELDAKRGREVY